MAAPGTARAGTLRVRVRAAAHALAGAPRLFRAARSAGAGRVEALGLLATSAAVLFLVAPRAAGVPGRQNAVRHFVWQALLTARNGPVVARAVADVQERGAVQPLDSAADRRNNAAGQAYGAAHREALAALPLRTVLRRLLHDGLAAWEAGELAAVSPGPGAASAGRRRRRSWPGRARTRRHS